MPSHLKPAPASPHVVVLVFGDLGRSPRMQYHALSLAEAGASVSLVGLAGEATADSVRDHPAIHIERIADAIGVRDSQGGRVRYLAHAGARVLLHVFSCLFLLLWRLPRFDFLLVQTPPALPTLPLAWFIARVRGAQLVIDWHNLGYSILALKLGSEHRLVRWTQLAEQHFGRLAPHHFCVSKGMSDYLRKAWGIVASPLPDRPNAAFRPATRDERTRTLIRLGIVAPESADPAAAADGTAVVVTATSWTIDEDMSLLVDAVDRLDARIAGHLRRSVRAHFPPMTILITGKGSLRAAFEERIAQRRWNHVQVRTHWLPWADYTALLGAADLGLSLHRSSSGVDLPMKILDMFGAGLPVCALDYGPGLDELLRRGENGILFSSSGELAHVLFDLFVDFPADVDELARLRRGVEVERTLDWTSVWRRVAAPIFGL